jgi:hypothetical protein
MANDLKLQVVWSMMERVTGPLKRISGGAKDAAQAMKATTDRLTELERKDRRLGEFHKLKRGLRQTSVELQAAAQRARDVGTQLERMKAQATPAAGAVKKLTAEHKKAQEVVDKLNASYRTNLEKNREMAAKLTASGINVAKQDGIKKTQLMLKESIAATNAELDKQRTKLTALHQHQKSVVVAQRHAGTLRVAAGHAAIAGVGATAAGRVMGMPVVAGIKEAKHYQTELGRVQGLGLSKQDNAHAINFANGMKTYGTSRLDNLQLMRDGITAFGDIHHAEMVAPTLAKMKFANHAFFGEEQGADNERKFMDMLKVIEMRGGLNSKDAFESQANIVQRVITATGGRVGPTEWLNMIKTGGIAAKGLKDDAFYYQMEPLVQEMSGNRVGTAMMSAYQNLYQGRTTKRSISLMSDLGLIGDESKVRHDKSGQISFLNPGAIKGADLFRDNQFEWMEKVLLPQLASKGITDERGVLDAIGGIFSNRTASNLFATMYQQRAQIHKNEKLNRGAADIDQLDKLGRDSAAGKELEMHARLADLKLTLGNKILPLYARGLELATHAVQALTGFMERNPIVAKAMIICFGALAALLVTLGPLLLAVAALIGPYAMLHVMFARLGIAGGVLTPILRGLGFAFMWLFRVLLMNPIGLLVTGLATAAVLIYANWAPISGFFAARWKEVQAAFAGGVAGIATLLVNCMPLGLLYTAFAGVMRWFGVDLPLRFTEFGALILRGLANGITGALGTVKDAVLGAGASVIGWFKDKLGIRSPSRVFAELGDFTMQGLALGMSRAENEPLTAVTSLARKLTGIGAGIAIGAASMPAMAFDTRPALTTSNAAPTVIQGDTITIQIYATPGMDEQALARAVSAELDRRDRDKAARRRASLSDTY